MSDWKSNYADPILPEGDVTVEVMNVKIEETTGGTPYASIMGRIATFKGEFNAEDPTVLSPEGQTVWGTVWLPKEADEAKKKFNKEVKVRHFLEAMEAAGAELVVDDPVNDKPSLILAKSLPLFEGKAFDGRIQHSVDESGQYPTRAELDNRVFRRVRD